MSTDKDIEKLSERPVCIGCNQPIWNGMYYIVTVGFIDDIVSADQEELDHYHLHCLDPYTILFGQLPGETIAVTLQGG
jgi:inorganic pyrophosphatase